MHINTKLGLFIVCFMTQQIIPGDDGGTKKHYIPRKKPNEPGIDYNVYKAGAIWPDWDCANPPRRTDAAAVSQTPNIQRPLLITTPSPEPTFLSKLCACCKCQ